MNRSTNALQILFAREVLVAFLVLLGIWVASMVFGVLRTLEHFVFAGYWALRHHFLIGDFTTQLLLTRIWHVLYAYLLALLLGSIYRHYF